RRRAAADRRHDAPRRPRTALLRRPRRTARAAAARLLRAGAVDHEVPDGPGAQRDRALADPRQGVTTGSPDRRPPPRMAARHGSRSPADRPHPPPPPRTCRRAAAHPRAPGAPRMRLVGKAALITGGARGQGAAHGHRLAEEGASVLLVDILDELGEAL